MSKTSQEIFSQYDTLERSLKHLDRIRDDKILQDVLKNRKRIIFIGCGSSYSIAKSAARVLRNTGALFTDTLPAGDVLVNTEEYIDLFDDAVLIIPSRSGQTDEIIRAIEKIRIKKNPSIISITMVEKSLLGDMSDFSIVLPWAFDESVCQTRSVTNLYASLLFIVGLITGQESLINEIKQVCSAGNKFMIEYKSSLSEIARMDWTHTVILADGIVEGIAEEGALAFKEICQYPSNHYNILDSRHGPAVLFNEKTLIIVFLSGTETDLQSDVIMDYLQKKCTIITVGGERKIPGVALHINLNYVKHREVSGIPFIYIPQFLSLEKALQIGVDPDSPTGLNPWIKLKEV